DALLSHFVCDIHLGRGTDSGLSTAACGFDIPATRSRDGGSFPVKQLTVSRATVRCMASQTRPSLWRRKRLAVAQERQRLHVFHEKRGRGLHATEATIFPHASLRKEWS